MNPGPILALIRRLESAGAVSKQGVASPYDVVWGGVRVADRPRRPLTSMTVAEVLAWQDGIDSRYQSEAAGAYQIMEDTLRELVSAGGVAPGDRFDAATQDACAIALMRRRGWDALCRGEMSAERFGDALAREWASFPVHSDQRGASRTVKRGQSYYAGDGLNAAHTRPEEVIAAIAAASEVPMPAHEIAFASRMSEALAECDRIWGERPDGWGGAPAVALLDAPHQPLRLSAPRVEVKGPNTDLPPLSPFSVKARSTIALLLTVSQTLFLALGWDASHLPGVAAGAGAILDGIQMLLPAIGAVWLWWERRAPNFRLSLTGR